MIPSVTQRIQATFLKGFIVRWVMPAHDDLAPFLLDPFVSAFSGKAELSAWQTWNACDEVSDVFKRLSKYSLILDDEALQTFKIFVVIMYDRSSSAAEVNDVWLEHYFRKQRSFDSIPPTQAALLQYAKRAAYQAGVIWSQSAVSQPEAHQSPKNWGWIQEA